MYKKTTDQSILVEEQCFTYIKAGAVFDLYKG